MKPTNASPARHTDRIKQLMTEYHQSNHSLFLCAADILVRYRAVVVYQNSRGLECCGGRQCFVDAVLPAQKPEGVCHHADFHCGLFGFELLA